ncbi:MAG: hypothetical protein ACON4J_08370 [Parvibaculales bacterium]
MKARFSFFVLILLLVKPAAAVESPLVLGKWQEQGPAKMRLLAGQTPDGRAGFGVEIRLEPGWRTYWKYPGGSGIEPLLNWAGSANFKPQGQIFETPMRFSDSAGDYFGYEAGTLISIPVEVMQTRLRPDPEPYLAEDGVTEIVPPALSWEEAIIYTGKALPPGGLLDVRLKVDIGVCQTVCLPLSFNFAGTLPQTDFASERFQSAFERHVKALPKPAGERLQVDNLTFDGVSLNMVVLGRELLNPEIIIAGGPLDRFEAPVHLGRDETAYLVSIPAWAGLDAPFIGRELEMVIVNGSHAVTQKITVQSP